MAKLLHTFWAFLLNVFGLQIFGTCFANAMEDEECESLLLGSPFSSILFTIGVYIIIANSTLFPPYFHEPKTIFLALYEVIITDQSLLSFDKNPFQIIHLLSRYFFSF